MYINSNDRSQTCRYLILIQFSACDQVAEILVEFVSHVLDLLLVADGLVCFV